MCTNYAAARRDRLFRHFGVEPPDSPWRDEIYKDYAAPIIRRVDCVPRADLATFGMVPRKHIPPGVRVFDTMNARAETLGEKRSFSGAWKRQQLCLVPCEAFYESCYETGKAVRWRIGMASGDPLAIAGLWREWGEEEGRALSFTMLTVNADSHALMNRFHKPGDEKRSVVILPPSEYENWLACRSMDEARSFLRLLPAEQLEAVAQPVAPKVSDSAIAR
ncbi:putative SOS response-associated peptidase YedK [Paraburkholderia bannensis]|uniref:Abasic site processing protein n=1 Tax=Paraburkholderia bannensis TaxID=765414 RepID=A0A7W9U064_9BURK|nr:MULTISPECIES: SOS response-associated peptidase family protein [Paraburkholderia]MBB3259631.1 putative SOS response-associated peptidase YedK [Paraburkholderia sp. WP4_3_2]MBB6104647.1 putative SOS response-associated peptidase YedK [Paraburkholderia bannensis]